MVTQHDLGAWERLLQSQEGVLAGIQTGGRSGIVRRDQAAGSGGEMIVWDRDGDVDVMFVIDDETLLGLCREDQPDPIRELRLGIRRGNVLLYFLRAKRGLRQQGHEDFVELIGVPLGGCQ